MYLTVPVYETKFLALSLSKLDTGCTKPKALRILTPICERPCYIAAEVTEYSDFLFSADTRHVVRMNP